MLPLGLILMFGSAIECVGMVSKSPYGRIEWPALLGCGGVMLSACIPVLWPLLAGEDYPEDCLLGALGWPLAAGMIAIVTCFVWFMPSYEQNSNFLPRAILSGWVSVYFGSCFAFAVALRLVGDSAWGLFLLVGVIVITKIADSGAYFAGKTLGRTKLIPAVSPGKTVEGLVGGMISSTLAAWIYFEFGPKYFLPEGAVVDVSIIGLVALGVLLTISGVVGDLLESVFKREMGCKDSGKLLPGLGGLWDVTDSLLPSMVVAYLVVVAELITGPGQ